MISVNIRGHSRRLFASSWLGRDGFKANDDDAKLYKHVTGENNHVSLQMGLDVLQEWSDRWLLKLNISKCKTVFYGRNINYDYNYYLHSNKLDKVDRMKDLGVTFDPELSFNFHCEDVDVDVE